MKSVGKCNTNYRLLYKCQVTLGLQPICLSRHTLSIEYCLFVWTLNSSNQPLYWSYHCSHWSTFIPHVNTVSCSSCYWLPNTCSLSNNLPTLFTAVSLCHCLVFESADDPSSGHGSMWRSLLGALDQMSLLSTWRQRKENPFLPLDCVVHGYDIWNGSNTLSPWRKSLPCSTANTSWVAEGRLRKNLKPLRVIELLNHPFLEPNC